MRKITSIFLALAIFIGILGSIGMSVHASDIQTGKWSEYSTYEYDPGTRTLTITAIEDYKSGQIPGDAYMVKYSIQDTAYPIKSNQVDHLIVNDVSIVAGFQGWKIKTLELNNVCFVEENAFKNCTELTEVVLPNYCEEVGYDSFAGCTKLQKLTIRNIHASLGYHWVKPGVYGYPSETTLGIPGQTVIYCQEGTMIEKNIQMHGYNFKVVYIPNLGLTECDYCHHTYELVITKQPTCWEDGCKQWLCTKCGKQAYDINGKMEPKPIFTEGHKFGMDHYCTICHADANTGFTDIDRNSWYYKALCWAQGWKITKGTTEHTFSPNETCTRAQIVTFLWRTYKNQLLENPECPFVDVDEAAYYRKAVEWAYEKGVVTGTTETTFSPNNTCTRAQIVTMMWRDAGSPESDYEIPFTDVKENSYYEPAVRWAVETGVIKGVSEDSFAPDKGCTRAEVVTILLRMFEQDLPFYGTLD